MLIFIYYFYAEVYQLVQMENPKPAKALITLIKFSAYIVFNVDAEFLLISNLYLPSLLAFQTTYFVNYSPFSSSFNIRA